MTAAFAGLEQPLVGRVEPKNDEVIVVFRNGKLHDVYDVGSRARALYLKFKPGTLTYARVLRSDISVHSIVPSVAVTGGWVLPRISVQAFVALNSVDDYGPLRRRLQERGLAFTEALASELHGEMDRFVRALFAVRTHEDVLARPNPAPADWQDARLLRDLFVIDSVQVDSVTGDPLFEQKRLEIQGQEVDKHRNERATLNALARDLTLGEWENPDLVALKAQQQHELLMKSHEAELDRMRIEVQKEANRLELQRAEIEARANITMAAITNARELSRVKGGVLPDLSFGTASVIEAKVVHPDLEAVEELSVPSQLGRDPGLIGAWRRAGGAAKAVRGVVQVHDDDQSLILIALTDDAAALPDTHDRLADAFPGQQLLVMPQSDLLVDWLEALVRARAHRVMDLQPSWLLQEDGDCLRIAVSSSTSRAGVILKQLLAPGALIVPGLDALLPYDEVICAAAGS